MPSSKQVFEVGKESYLPVVTLIETQSIYIQHANT